jgi:hypothetical protein
VKKHEKLMIRWPELPSQGPVISFKRKSPLSCWPLIRQRWAVPGEGTIEKCLDASGGQEGVVYICSSCFWAYQETRGQKVLGQSHTLLLPYLELVKTFLVGLEPQGADSAACKSTLPLSRERERSQNLCTSLEMWFTLGAAVRSVTGASEGKDVEKMKEADKRQIEVPDVCKS